MSLSIKKEINSFRRVSLITVIAVYFLILIGGIVRSTGSGMGCPDWPKCFGSVIPPTSVNQLPTNYQEIYLEKRVAKNVKFVSTLEKLGLKDTADKISKDKSILVEEEFNVAKTWIEYLNRLVGVIIGLLILITVWKSLKLWSFEKKIPLSAILSLVLVLFTGWIGSIVVSTNLLPWVITFHMLLALGLVLLLIYAYHKSSELCGVVSSVSEVPWKVRVVLILGFLLMIVQVVLGTQVREQIDRISFSLGGLFREEWVGKVGLDFLIHRSFSIILLLTHLLYFFWVFKYAFRKSAVNLWTQILMLVLLLEIVTGISMAYFGIPAYLQPLHLVLGSILLGIQFFLILQLKSQTRLNITK
jgi:heme a synthase